MSAEPWSKFFWSDYDADEGLRFCTLAAQGLWMRMLCLMAKASPKGELRVGGEPCTVTDLSRAVGESDEMVQRLLDELVRRGVYSLTRAGVIYSRRLRKDAELSRKRAKAGAKGAAATNQRFKDNPDLPQQNPGKASDKRAAPEARSQSSDTNVSADKPPDPVKVMFDLGVEVITGAGFPESRARSLVAQWQKQEGDAETIRALMAARGKTEPISWIKAYFANKRQQSDGLGESVERIYAAK